MTETKKRILIVEDERIVARHLQRKLALFGYEVVGVAASGEGAIELAKRERPDLVLMDIQLQGAMDGTAAAARIRATLEIPIVFLTAFSDEATLRAMCASEPFGYILKPFHERELRIVIEMAFYKHAAEIDRVLLERRLLRAEKMDAIGQLAGGIAHDFNNVLMVILLNCNTLLQDLTQQRRSHDQVALIRAAAERAARMTKQLLVFGRGEKVDVGPVDLGVVVNSMAAMLRPLIGDDIALVTRIAPNVQAVLARASDLEQIILNLAVNARDAMPDGGTITIDVENTPATDTAPAGVNLVVSDAGAGMTEATRQRIFEPFFTTKDVGTGAGLGLSTVYGLVTKSGGRLEVACEHGTHFTLWWPSTDASQISPVLAGSAASPLAGTVVVVEDDDQVRKLLCDILTGVGLEVHGARDGIEALEVCSEHSVDLVLSDVVMPRMGGSELLERLATVTPRTKVIYMSGYPDRSIPGGRANISPVLVKPFTPMQLLEAIRTTMTSE